MVDTTLLIAVLIFFVGAILIFKIIKGILKALALVVALLVIVLAGLGALVYLDVQDFTEKFGNEPVLFLMIEDEKATAGVEFIAGSEELIPEVQVNRHSLFLKDRDAPILAQDHYKVILVEKSLLLENDISDGAYNDGLNDEDYNVRNEAFSGAITHAVDSPFLIARNIRDDRLKVVPETIAFKVINFLPESFTSTLTSRIKQTAEKIFQDND